MLTLADWKTRTHDHLRTLADTLRDMAPGVTYGALSAAAILPLVAASQGSIPYGALAQVLGDIGIGLIAGQVQALRDRSEAEIAAELNEKASTDPNLREALDTILEKLDALRVVKEVLSEADKHDLHQRFVTSLRQELEKIGSRLTVEGDYVEGDKFDGDKVAGDKYIAQIINLYRQPDDKFDEAELQRQIRSYLAWVIERYGRIVLRGVEHRGRNVINLDLAQVYVPLQATARTRKAGRKQPASAKRQMLEESIQADAVEDIRLDQLLGVGNQLIVTGGPGCGKTTVLQHIAWTLATALVEDDAGLAKEKLGIGAENHTPPGQPAFLPPLPIYIPLSRYASYRRDLHQRRHTVSDEAHKITLTSFISHYLIEREKVGLPADFFARLVDRGQAVVLLLDGLDEAPNDEERQAVCTAIEDLLAGKKSLRVVVTCRTAAYKGETMLNEEFAPVQVKALAEAQVTALVAQAFGCIEPNDVTARQQQTSELTTGIGNFEAERKQRMGDDYRSLIDSPLMVRLLLIVYLTGRGFPQQRADLYERASKALLKPDYTLDNDTAKHIGEQVGGNPAQHRALVEYIAFQMHQQGEKQGRDLTEGDLKKLIQRVPEFAGLADDFIHLTRVRGSLMEERLRVYRFFHLSFQEYLAACYLAKTRMGEGGVDGLARFFEGDPVVGKKGRKQEPPLLDSWWREVALLIAGHLISNEDLTNARRFLRRLAGVDEGAKERPPLGADVQLVAAEVAIVSCLEWLTQDKHLCSELAQRMASLFANYDLMNGVNPSWRAAAGGALAKLGDPRPGVGVKNGLPDIAWSKVIEAGPFIMGSDKRKDKLADNRELPQFTCTLIKQPYRLSRYPVTVAQYRCFIDDKGYEQEKYWTKVGWQWRKKEKITGPGTSGGVFELDNHPQVNVSWYEAVAFCKWLAEKLGQPIRLPSEAEWERAARHTDGRIYAWGNDFDKNYCNMRDTGIGSTSAVGIFPKDRAECGATDMMGNVWEWCSTEWSANYQDYQQVNRDIIDGQGNEKEDKGRVLRGGAWYYFLNHARCAARYWYEPSNRYRFVGFRLFLPGSESLPSSSSDLQPLQRTRDSNRS